LAKKNEKKGGIPPKEKESQASTETLSHRKDEGKKRGRDRPTTGDRLLQGEQGTMVRTKSVKRRCPFQSTQKMSRGHRKGELTARKRLCERKTRSGESAVLRGGNTKRVERSTTKSEHGRGKDRKEKH